MLGHPHRIQARVVRGTRDGQHLVVQLAYRAVVVRPRLTGEQTRAEFHTSTSNPADIIVAFATPLGHYSKIFECIALERTF
jgi:hypothetical protein